MSVQWTGLEEFRNALRNLPEDLAHEAEAIVLTHAQEAERLVEGAYPIGPQGSPKSNSGNPPGALRRGVRMTVENAGRAGVRAVVRSRANHAHLFEKGTSLRRNKHGASRGRMPEAPPSQQMIPIVIRVRRRMVTALIHMVQKAGLVVTES